MSAVLRITCTDLMSGESETTEIPAGEYVLLTTEPCHVASTQAYPAKGTHVITIKGHGPRAASQGHRGTPEKTINTSAQQPGGAS